MKKILVILFILLIAAHFIGRTQTTNFSGFVVKPLANAEINSPGRGAQLWNGSPWGGTCEWCAVQVPDGTTETGARSTYIRWNWYVLETAPGVYDFNNTGFPGVAYYIRWAIDNKQDLYLGGIMPVDQSSMQYTYQGGSIQYPSYLWDSINLQMSAGFRNFLSADALWVPNWNSPVYLRRLEILVDTLYKFIKNYSYNGKTGAQVLRMADIRGYGNFGEWHDFSSNGRYYDEAGYQNLKPTIATLKKIIDIHCDKMPDIPLTIISNSFDAGNASDIPAEVMHYTLTRQNAWGHIGYRRDNISNPGVVDITINNPGSFSGMNFDTAITNRWKYAPVSGEPWKGGFNNTYANIDVEIPQFHYFGFGNGNYVGSQLSGQINEEMRGYFKRTGYRYNWISGYMTTNPVQNQSMTVQLRWANVNGIPLYDKNWTVKYKIKNSGGTVLQTFNSSFDLFLMYSTDTTITESFTPTITGTNLSLSVSIEDDLGFHNPIQIAMNTPVRNADGSHTLRSGFTIAAGGASAPPVSNAGADQVLNNGTTSATVNGNGSTDDVAITAYSWTNVSGPNTPTIVSPASVSSNITGLVTGTYLLRLVVTDGDSQTDDDTVQIRVNALPVSAAGNDQVLANGVSSSSLNGSSSSDPDGSISVYAWTKVSGPAGNTFGTPNAASTTIGSLSTGTYIFRLTVTDNNGQTGTDDITVRVNALPVSAAGTDQTLGVGTASTTLNGSGSSDPDGTITAYTWSQISGTAATIVSPSASSTNITALTSGVRIFRLTVTDNNGGTNTDDVQIFVGNVIPYQLATPTEKPFNATGGHWTRNPERMLDGNTTTSYQVGGDNDDGYDGLYYPTQNYFVLDSNYNNLRIRIFTGNGNPGYSIKLLSQGFTDSMIINVTQGSTLYQNWNWIDTMLTQFATFPVRVVELTVRDGEQDLTEIQFYGNVFNTSITQYFPYANPVYNRNFLDFHGQNVNGDEPDSLYNTTRLINVNGLSVYYDTTTNSSTLGNRPFIVSIFGPEMNWQEMKDSGKVVYTYTMGANAANREVPKPAPAQGSIYNYYGTDAERYKNIPYGSDSTNKANWVDEYRLHAMLAGYFGNNPSANMVGFIVNFKNGISTIGQNLLKGSEADNEDDRNWKDRTGFHNSQVKIVKLAGVYDSAKSKDPTWEITDGAMSNPDTQYVKGKALWSIRYRGLNNYPADNVAFNYYVTDLGGQWPGAKGISPEKGRMLEKLKGFVYNIHTYIGPKKTFYREANWDASPNTRYSAPTIAGISSRRVAAALYLRLLHIARSAGVDAIFQFTNRDESADQNNPVDFVTMGQHTGYRDNPDSAFKRWPLSYAMFMSKEVYKNYNGAPTILINGDSTGNWVLRDEPEAGYDTITYTIWSARDDNNTYAQAVNAPNGKTFTWIEQIKPEYGANDMGTGVLYGNRMALTPGTSFSVNASITPISVRVVEQNIGGVNYSRPIGRYRLKAN